LPLVAGDEVLGALSFGTLREERQWPIDLRERLAVVAHVFANALARKRSDLELRSANAELSRLKERLEIDNQYLRQELSAVTDDDAIVAVTSLSADATASSEPNARHVAARSSVTKFGHSASARNVTSGSMMRGFRLLPSLNTSPSSRNSRKEDSFWRMRSTTNLRTCCACCEIFASHFSLADSAFDKHKWALHFVGFHFFQFDG